MRLVSRHPDMEFLPLVVLVILLPSCAVANNIALNKPSLSSHVYNDAVPERGNDGDTNTVFSQGSCVLAQATVSVPNPWWQVNLEAEYYVYSVAITNRVDAFEWRLHNFTVEVYSEDPTTPGAVGQVCAVYPGTVGSGLTEELVCAPGVRGWYVRIQKNSMLADDALQFCEVEVNGKHASRAMYSRLPGQRLPGTPLSQDSGTAADCGRICFNTPRCDGFNFDGGYGGGTGTCQFMFQQETPVTDAGYAFYKSTLFNTDIYFRC